MTVKAALYLKNNLPNQEYVLFHFSKCRVDFLQIRVYVFHSDILSIHGMFPTFQLRHI